MVSQNIYDIILMDIVMPQFTGTDAMLKIRKHADASATKIIAHTFSENENSNNKYIKLGFNGLLLKPVKQSILIENIRTFLKWLMAIVGRFAVYYLLLTKSLL